MLSRGLQSLFTETPITVFGMLLFLITYLAVVAYVFGRRDSRAHYQSLSEMPLNNEEVRHG